MGREENGLSQLGLVGSVVASRAQHYNLRVDFPSNYSRE